MPGLPGASFRRFRFLALFEEEKVGPGHLEPSPEEVLLFGVATIMLELPLLEPKSRNSLESFDLAKPSLVVFSNASWLSGTSAKAIIC